MSNKAVFLDRDGTINQDKGYIYKIEDFVFLEEAIEGLKMLREAGYLLIIITNQSGIARGYYGESDYQKLTQYMLDKLREEKVKISAIYHCPHIGDECECRKPKKGLFYQAALEYNIDFSRSVAIGDKMRDLCICEDTDCRGYLISKGKVENQGVECCNSILEVARKICINKGKADRNI